MNKKIIITGASRGIGRELVKCFLEQGHDVLAISRNEEKLKELEKFATKSTYRYLALDLADFEGLTKVKSAIADWDRVEDRKSTRLNSSHVAISYAVFC